MPFDPYLEQLWILKQTIANGIKHAFRLRDDDSFVRDEMDLVQDHNLIATDDRLDVIRTTSRAAATFLIRAVVIDIHDSIAVIVFLGTAVVIFVTVLVFFDQRAKVYGVGQAIVVVIEFGAAVTIAMTIEVFWLIRAAVIGI